MTIQEALDKCSFDQNDLRSTRAKVIKACEENINALDSNDINPILEYISAPQLLPAIYVLNREIGIDYNLLANANEFKQAKRRLQLYINTIEEVADVVDADLSEFKICNLLTEYKTKRGKWEVDLAVGWPFKGTEKLINIRAFMTNSKKLADQEELLDNMISRLSPELQKVARQSVTAQSRMLLMYESLDSIDDLKLRLYIINELSTM